MRICEIWDADYPWDIRVEKVSASLVEAGHTVALVCRNQGRRVRKEVVDQVAIRRLPSIPASLGPLHALCNFPLLVNPVWIYAIAKTIREVDADLILVRDLPLALPAALLGKIYRIPVVLDMAENYPAMLEDVLRYYPPMGFWGRLARHPSVARVIERWTVRVVDHIIAVVEESRDRLVNEGVPPEKLSVVSNTPKAGLWQVPDPIGSKNKEQTKGIELVYLGNVDGIRGIDVVIRALRILEDMRYDVCFTVIGKGPNLTQFQEMAERLGVRNRVYFAGHKSIHDPRERVELQAIMARSHIGLIPHYATESCNTTIPNKLFDYMAMGLPVIVSNMPPTERVVLQEACGEVFQDRNAGDLARCIRGLSDSRVRMIKGLNALAAVQKRYHWEYDANVLLNALQHVERSVAGRSK
jgi:glycosyltransferase involved in cell wall biosynthesis